MGVLLLSVRLAVCMRSMACCLCTVYPLGLFCGGLHAARLTLHVHVQQHAQEFHIGTYCSLVSGHMGCEAAAGCNTSCMITVLFAVGVHRLCFGNFVSLSSACPSISRRARLRYGVGSTAPAAHLRGIAHTRCHFHTTACSLMLLWGLHQTCVTAHVWAYCLVLLQH
ncbi:hypothetical protein COO60DRAFT_768690 [Scenedesmus sp. NREL 46B-D3]|nr:hypothetical protein COO60DRAFT_768690 [Scenedesmus sp. NREL 46B-D3]